MERIVIEVSGGVVQAVYGAKSRVQVALVDWDNINAPEGRTGPRAPRESRSNK